MFLLILLTPAGKKSRINENGRKKKSHYQNGRKKKSHYKNGRKKKSHYKTKFYHLHVLLIKRDIG